VKEGRQDVLFLKKKNQKNFSPFATRPSQGLVLSMSSLRARRSAFAGALAKQSRTFACFSGPSANQPDGLKLPSRVPNRSQTEKSFFGSFFSKKEQLAFLPLAFLKPTGPHPWKP
jgi:hypothetical protein